MRGTHHARADGLFQPGIIPAYAGNTMQAGCRKCSSRDHPRVCGEHALPPLRCDSGGGSSPRMRGTQFNIFVIVIVVGIIPAYAGNTATLPTVMRMWKDHPRVCGEHHRGPAEKICVAGSSPRMRGTLADTVDEEAHHGIIPAYAGNTVRLMPPPPNHRDHPRVCGEH